MICSICEKHHMSPLGNYPQLQFACLLILGALLGAFGIEAHAEMAPLPSWNEGPAKQAIVTFVKKTTDQAGPKFVPPSERIAVFDNDGTLWPENPMPFQ